MEIEMEMIVRGKREHREIDGVLGCLGRAVIMRGGGQVVVLRNLVLYLILAMN